MATPSKKSQGLLWALTNPFNPHFKQTQNPYQIIKLTPPRMLYQERFIKAVILL